MKKLTAAGRPWGSIRVIEADELKKAFDQILPLAEKLGMTGEDVRQMFQQLLDAGAPSTDEMVALVIKTLDELIELEDQIGLNKEKP